MVMEDGRGGGRNLNVHEEIQSEGIKNRYQEWKRNPSRLSRVVGKACKVFGVKEGEGANCQVIHCQ